MVTDCLLITLHLHVQACNHGARSDVNRREVGHWHPPTRAGHFTLKAWIGTHSWLSGPSVRKCWRLRFVNIHKRLWADQRERHHEPNRGLRQRYTDPSAGLNQRLASLQHIWVRLLTVSVLQQTSTMWAWWGGSVSWNLCPPPLDIRPSQYVNAILHCLLQSL